MKIIPYYVVTMLDSSMLPLTSERFYQRNSEEFDERIGIMHPFAKRSKVLKPLCSVHYNRAHIPLTFGSNIFSFFSSSPFYLSLFPLELCFLKRQEDGQQE